MLTPTEENFLLLMLETCEVTGWHLYPHTPSILRAPYDQLCQWYYLAGLYQKDDISHAEWREVMKLTTKLHKELWTRRVS
jgi:hypothetical protein